MGDPGRVLEIRSAKMDVYTDLVNQSSIVAREGVADYLEKPRISTGELVVASLTPDSFAQRILKASGLWDFFTHILTEASVSRLKPYPDVYLLAAEKSGVVSANLIVHEDSPPGVAAAKRAGSLVAAFPVYENLNFDPKPDLIYTSWIGLDPGEIAEKLVR